MRSGLARDLLPAPALTALCDPLPAHAPRAPVPRSPVSRIVPAGPSQFGGQSGCAPRASASGRLRCAQHSPAQLAAQPSSAVTGCRRYRDSLPCVSRDFPGRAVLGRAGARGEAGHRAVCAGLFVCVKGRHGRALAPTAGASRAARAFPSRGSGARVASLGSPLACGDGAVPGAEAGAGEGTCRGSPAGLGSSAGRAGLEDLRARGGSRSSRLARRQLLGAHSTHGELGGSLGVTHARGADRQEVWGQKPIELGEGWTRNCGSPPLQPALSSLPCLRGVSLVGSQPHEVTMGTRCSPHPTPAGVTRASHILGRFMVAAGWGPLTPKNVWTQ